MNYRNLAAMINPEMTTLKACYVRDAAELQEAKKYTFKVSRGLAFRLSVGDYIVVANASDTITKVVMVASVDNDNEIDIDDNIDYAWVVDKVDTTEFEKNVRKEIELAVAIEKERRKSIKASTLDRLGLSNIDLLKLIN